ncbi:ABC transporter permease subunit [Actinomadura viridis]|uniref:Spermidine/putrescine transport system permease protein n=1 Tax=Actinomadura viridis TaxID=58110 RepID=A0A931DN04_9ACTN|nr:ABC transporter permease subunit [Actinomadura viridis]MBG6090601.1 putative spermidine/putrescine transport system permease protein [Actinomadura viridis]
MTAVSFMASRRRALAGWAVWGCVAFFLLNLAALILSVVVNSFGTTWFSGWLPQGFTTAWYADAWKEFALGEVLQVTLGVTLAVVALSLLLGVPAAYALARRDFPGKRLVLLLLLLPVLLPPITYGIPLATVLYKFHLAGTMTGVVAANLVPALPFVVLVMTPFVEQIDANVESAARMCGARTRQVFSRVLVPLLMPGILAAGILVLVRTVAMFELTFLVADADSQTLIVALYSAAFTPGIRAAQAIDAMAVIYMALSAVLLVVALLFVNPTQIVAQVKEATAE